jgi:hypothetical protein
MDFPGDVCTHDESGFGDLHEFPILLILHLSTSSCCFRVKAILTGGTLFFQNPDSFLNRNACFIIFEIIHKIHSFNKQTEDKLPCFIFGTWEFVEDFHQLKDKITDRML